MENIEKSRLIQNLWRDLHNNFVPDESLSILNTSNRDIEITDDSTGVTKIVYPRTIFHTARPKTSLTIMQEDGDKTYKAMIPRSMIKKTLVSVETPLKFREPISSYSDLLSMNWINKVLRNADRILITPFTAYYIIVDPPSMNYHIEITLLLIALITLFAALLFL